MYKLKKFILKFFLVLLFSGALLLIYWQEFLNKYVFKSDAVRDDLNVKYILYWTPFWNQKDYFYGYGTEPFKNCEYKNCYATDNRTFIPLHEFDALLFHASYYKKQHGVPWIRKNHQRYIFMNVEAPVYICPNLKQYASYFNWTMSYRFDSDIVRRHGYIFKENTNYSLPSDEFINKKTKLAAWFVSNCRTPGKREILVKQIQKLIPVDIYGSCGPLRCVRKKGNGKLSSSECYEMVEKNYKFYFSFENSYCKDYSTEKLYNLLERNVVPIVYGAGDYKLSAPPNSVINIEDFKSIEEFANYLVYLDKNNTEYLKYFQWKMNYRITQSPLPSACQMCEKLNEPLEEKVYHDLHGWWWGQIDPVCRIDKNLPHHVSDFL